MRISSAFQYETYRRDIAEAHSRYVADQTSVATGKRFERMEQDPIASGIVLRASSLMRRYEQVTANLRVANDYLASSAVAFQDTVDSLREAYSVAIRGADSLSSGDERITLARQIELIQKRVADLGNSRGADDQYIFAGQNKTTPAFKLGDGLKFIGDGDPILVEVRPGQTMRVDSQGAGSYFEELYSRLESLRNHLLSNDPGSISTIDLGKLKESLTIGLGLQAEAGFALQTTDRLKGDHETRVDELSTRISDTQDVDLAEAVTAMQQSESAYQAALRVAASGARLQLMDFVQ